MQLQQVMAVLDDIAPTRLAGWWDTVGLLLGDPRRDVWGAMLCIDSPRGVAWGAAGEKCALIVAYPPPLFHAIKRLSPPSPVFDAIRRGVAIYSPHTALDVAD